MRSEKIYYVICLLLLATAFGNSACSSTKINAQPSGDVRASSERPAESPTPGYKKPKRVSQDVISSDEKEAKAVKVKTKAK